MKAAAKGKRSGGEQERDLLAPDGILHSGCDVCRDTAQHELIMMLMSRTEFTEDGCMNTLMRVPEDKIEFAKSQGAVIDEDSFAAIEQTT